MYGKNARLNYWFHQWRIFISDITYDSLPSPWASTLASLAIFSFGPRASPAPGPTPISRHQRSCLSFVFLSAKSTSSNPHLQLQALLQDLLLSFAVWMKTRKPHFDCPSFWLLIFQHFQRIFSNAFYLFLFAPVCHMPSDVSGIEFRSTKWTLFSRGQWGKCHILLSPMQN